MTQKFLIQDSKGNIYNEVTRPAAVFDTQLGTLHKIGEYDDMLAYYEHLCYTYKAGGFPEMAADLAVMDLPADQKEIDKVFQSVDYIGLLYKRMKKEIN